MMSVAGLLLILAGLQGFLFQTIHVSQIPEILTPEGSSVTLPCTYSISGAQEVASGSYKWYRHLVRVGPEVSDSNKHFAGRVSRTDTDVFISNRSAGITLHGVDITDTGMYYCDVTLRQHTTETSGHGAGTFLNVTAVPDAGSSQASYMVQNVVRLVLGVLVCALLCYFVVTAAHFPSEGIKET